jgi:GDP/UDP-N,N'-diacetylbacillosamine 2-epimerase (hydrolysing)
MIGNSSAGIIEAASFGTPVINIGRRQNLRERNANVLDVAVADAGLIDMLTATMAKGRYPAVNIYGDGSAGQRIAALLSSYDLSPALLMKVNGY